MHFVRNENLQKYPVLVRKKFSHTKLSFVLNNSKKTQVLKITSKVFYKVLLRSYEHFKFFRTLRIKNALHRWLSRWMGVGMRVDGWVRGGDKKDPFIFSTSCILTSKSYSFHIWAQKFMFINWSKVWNGKYLWSLPNNSLNSLSDDRNVQLISQVSESHEKRE